MALKQSSVAQLQQNIPSGFTVSNTADDIIKGIDLHGKNVIVTGGYSGIGLETTRVLAAAGANVFAPARDVKRASEALKGLKGHIEVDSLELSDRDSIDSFVRSFLAKKIPLHILINNAGVISNVHEVDSRGFEKQFSVNHLGPFQLTVGLLPALREAKGARVVNVGSLAHNRTPVLFDDINFKKTEYSVWLAYGQSKTANSLFALELDKREKQNGIRAFSLHPGLIVTPIIKEDELKGFLKTIGAVDAEGKPVIDASKGYKTPAQGASTSVFAATSPLLDKIGGVYLENNDIAHVNRPDPSDPSKTTSGGVHLHAIDDNDAKRLWELSEALLVQN